MGAEAFVYGFSYPYFSLSLHRLGLTSGLIGLNSSIACIGIIFLGPFLPRLLARFGLRTIGIIQFALAGACFGVLLLSQVVIVWFLARFVLGTIVASVWTTTEIWLNAVVSNRRRGLILGISGAVYACCEFLGPLALGLFGVSSQAAVLTAFVPLAAGVLVAACLRRPASRGLDEEPATHTLRRAVTVARPLLIAGFISGFGDASMLGLLPLYGLSHGLSVAASARLVAAFSAGEAVLVLVLGWLADRYRRASVIIGTMLAAALAACVLPLAGSSTWGLLIVSFALGGTICSLYTLLTVLMGTNFTGTRLSTVASGFTVAYSIGSVTGPAIIGFLMHAVGASALPESIAIAFAAAAFVLLADHRRGVTRQARGQKTKVGSGGNPLNPTDE